MLARLFAAVAAAVFLLAGLGASPAAAQPPAEPPDMTINPFLPEDRSLGECISSIQKPGCGSDARGGWPQTIVFLAVVAGLAFIGWRVVRGSRRVRAAAASAETATNPPSPDATSAPAERGDDPAP